MERNCQLLCVFVIVAWVFSVGSSTRDIQSDVVALRQMNARPRLVTVSGFSSGGNLAQMLLVAHSAKIIAAAVFSHTFYRCGEGDGDIIKWLDQCTQEVHRNYSKVYSLEKVYEDISNYNSSKLIDDPVNLKNKRLYVYAGLRDKFFSPSQSLSIIPVFEKYIRNPFKIKTRVQDATHLMPTDYSNGSNCKDDASGNNFIGNCRFSGAYEAIRFILSDHFQIRHPNKMINLHVRPLTAFNQSEFLKGIKNHQMDEIGYYYIPIKCLNLVVPCFVHVFLHGCQEARGPEFILKSGFLEVSEANGIIMLFPQNNPTDYTGTPVEGCWDTFGSGGKFYATKVGPQLRVIWKMITRLIGRNKYPTFYEVPTNVPRSQFHDRK